MKRDILKAILVAFLIILGAFIIVLFIEAIANKLNQNNPEVQIKATERIRGEQYYTLILNDTAYDYVTLLEIDSILKTK